MKKLFSKINFKIIIEKIKNLSKAKKIAVVSIATILVLVLFIEFVVAPFYERGLFPESLVLDFQNYNVRVGDSHIVYANGIYADNTTSIIKKLKCKSSDESILSTDGNVIIGKKEGTVELECDYWWRKTKTKVTVLKVEEAFSVSPKYLSQEYKRYQSKKDEEDRVGLNVVVDEMKYI